MAEMESRFRELDERESTLATWEASLKERAEALAAGRTPQHPEPPSEGEDPEGSVDPAMRAMAFLEEGDLEGAAEWYRRAAHAGDESAWMNLAEVLLLLNRPDDAMQAYDAAIVRDPTDSAALMGKFSIQVGVGKMVEAVATTRLLLQFDPGATRHLAEIAGVLEVEGRVDDAVTIYNTLLREEPDNPVVRVMLGTLLCQIGDLDAAEEHIEAAVQLDPNSERAWYARGLLMDARGRWGAAVQYFDRALSIRWDFPEAWRGKGEIHLKKGHHGDAEECFRKALEERPGEPGALMGLAEALAEQGRTAEALEALDQVPESWDMERVARVREKVEGQEENPFAVLKRSHRASSEKPDAWEAWLTKGKALLDLGEPEDALECFDRVLEREPEHELALKLKEECLAKMPGG
jgi:tetratricopeptide (TPR) repeat protein